MQTGFRGTYVISWGQTEIDGLPGAPVSAVAAGASWRWGGAPLRVDGPGNILQLEQSDGERDLRRSAARSVRRLVGLAIDPKANETGSPAAETESGTVLRDRHFVVTDGLRNYTVTLIEVGQGQRPLLMFVDCHPPQDTDLWIVDVRLEGCERAGVTSHTGVICFTPGTILRTPAGGVPVEHLQEGDWIQTRDSGAQQIQWIGARRMTGARLFVTPELRPVRISGGALGMQRPDADLLVSPSHRVLLRGSHVQSLFNTSEVLVAARDLINGRDIAVDTQLREVTYIHLLLSDHQVLWANGVETESFHPAQAALSALRCEDRRRLLQVLPDLEVDPMRYGDFARRNLSQPEAAILRHAAA
ncbi:Hint domain-containing protein [Phaeobacter inhibens]|uniref:Hint domain-containing protein n=1 Tax=Phaeobacter inhibens TaxID=221822 RepID=UPI000C9AE216|nr:Hint domain-containing protein [Phaeobacter inhibens]AUQ71287.1 Hint domain protein [Phaeobacter inhibens]